jgi:hexosaminidase
MNWAGFLRRLPVQMQRYHRQGIAAADSAFAVDFQLADGRNAALQSGAGRVTLANQTAFGTIRFTLDGSEPGPQSPLYEAPLALELGATIKATAFSGGLPLAAARAYDFNPETLLERSSNQLRVCAGDNLRLRLPLTPDSPAIAPVYDVDLFKSCFVYANAPLKNVTALQVDIARLSRNFGLANHENQVKSYAATTPFGELVIFQDRCEAETELARAPLPDPAGSDNRQSVAVPIAPGTGDHDLCFIFTAPVTGPLYAIGAVKLVRSQLDARRALPDK